LGRGRGRCRNREFQAGASWMAPTSTPRPRRPWPFFSNMVPGRPDGAWVVAKFFWSVAVVCDSSFLHWIAPHRLLLVEISYIELGLSSCILVKQRIRQVEQFSWPREDLSARAFRGIPEGNGVATMTGLPAGLADSFCGRVTSVADTFGCAGF
jgi:hypothetical protein